MLKIKNKKLFGNIGINLISGITAITFAGIAMQMGYSNFKAKAEKQLHILNGIRFSTIVQIGLEEGWIEKPIESETITVYLSEVETNYNLATTLKNPSNTSQAYSAESFIIIENNNNKYKFYVELIEGQSDHIYIQGNKEVHLLTVDDVNLDSTNN